MMTESDMREVVQLLQSLIQIPSITGHEQQIAHYLKDYLESCGFKSRVNTYNTVIGVLDLGEGPTVLLDGHIDTVPANPEEWSHPPHGGLIDHDCIYGRGASDMKGALAAMIIAGKCLAREKKVKGKIVITGTSWEEYFEGYTLGKALDGLAQEGIKPDYVIIGEASELNLKRGQRGRTRVIVDVKGKASHSAHPESGINAVYKAQRLITALQACPLPENPFLGKHIIELIGIESWPNPVDSVVPYQCRVTYDLRLLPGESKASVLQEFAAIIQQVQATDPEFEADVRLAGGEVMTHEGVAEWVEALPPAWVFPADAPFLQTAEQALRAIGLTPAVTKYDFCTNGSYSAGIAHIPTLGFGPGKETSAHTVDESLAIDDLQQACAGYIAIARALLGA